MECKSFKGCTKYLELSIKRLSISWFSNCDLWNMIGTLCYGENICIWKVTECLFKDPLNESQLVLKISEIPTETWASLINVLGSDRVCTIVHIS